MMIGVDLAKAVFQVQGAHRTGEVQFRKKLSRRQFPAVMAQQEPCLVIFEACGSAHCRAREMEVPGHEVKLIAPQHVRPFVKRQKNEGEDRGCRAAAQACERCRGDRHRGTPAGDAPQSPQDGRAAVPGGGLLWPGAPRASADRRCERAAGTAMSTAMCFPPGQAISIA